MLWVAKPPFRGFRAVEKFRVGQMGSGRVVRKANGGLEMTL